MFSTPKFQLLVFASLLIASGSALAQAPEIAQSELVRSDQRACAYSEFLDSYLDSLSDDEISSLVQTQSDRYSEFVASDESELSTREYKLRKKIEQDFFIIAHARTPRTQLKIAAGALCTAGRVVGGTLLNGVALGASAITSAITFPVRFVGKFGIGAVTRKSDHVRGVSYADFTGTGWDGNLIAILYEAYRVEFVAANPFWLSFYGITAIDIAFQEHCRGADIKSDRSAKACKAYEALKTGEYDGTEVGRRAGAAFGTKLLMAFDFRSDENANPKLCEKNFKTQIRVGIRARARLLNQLASDGMKDVTVLVNPPDLNECVTLSVGALTKDQKTYIEQNYTGFTDGIPHVLELKKDEPKPPVVAATPTPTSTPIPSPTPDYTKDENICKAVYEAQVTDFVMKPKNNVMKEDLIQMVLSPTRFGKLASESYVTAPNQMLTEPVTNIGQGRNVILVIAPSEAQRAEYEAILPHLDELKAEYKVEGAKLKWLKKTHTFESCMARQEVTEFNFIRYKELSEAIKNITVAQRITDFQAMDKQAKKAGVKLFGLRHTLKIDWEIREMNSLNDLRDTLTDPELLNLIVVSHGNESGKIVDSRFNELPSTAFERIQPNLQSISFFSCHSDKAPETYFMKDQLNSHASYQQIRSVNHVISSDALEAANEAPTLALNAYIESVDLAAYRAILGNARAQMAFASKMKVEVPEVSKCSVSFDGLSLLKGAFSLKLNQHWAGTVYSGEAIQTMNVPCDWLNAPKIKAVLEQGSLVDLPAIKSANVILKIHSDHGDLNLVKPIPKLRDTDRSISRLTWIQ